MREIKFRAWDKKNHLMRYASMTDTAVGMGSLLQAIAKKQTDTLMQYTGLKDKNGVEIYEGDIVVRHDYPFYSEGNLNYVSVVEWEYAAWYHNIRPVSDRVRGGAVGGPLDEAGKGGSDFEVIGNIYENPNLLEGKKDE